MRSEKHLENIRQDDINIPEWFFNEEQGPIMKKIKKVYNFRTIKQIARDKNMLDDKELEEELAEKMINPYSFIDENLKTGFKINIKTLF